MAKTKETVYLEKAIYSEVDKMGTFPCLEVTIGIGGNKRVDMLSVDTRGIWRCFEIKQSIEDFRSKNGHNFVGNYNYYVMTSDLYEKVKDSIPKDIGVYIGSVCKKKARHRELSEPESVLMISMVRSLQRDAKRFVNGNFSEKLIDSEIQESKNKEEPIKTTISRSHKRFLDMLEGKVKNPLLEKGKENEE